MDFCEVCGKEGERHHIVWRSQGGLEYPMNYKYLCKLHHRGHLGPHSSSVVDLKYKLELQNKLQEKLHKEYYTLKDIMFILHINKRNAKQAVKFCRLYKEGYKKEDIIEGLMGGKLYSSDDIVDYELLKNISLIK